MRYLLIVLALVGSLTACGRQCPPGFVNDGNNNCISDGRGGNFQQDDDAYEGDDD